MEEGHSLFPAVAVEEAGPLEAGLLAAHPEDGGDANHQRHQVLDEKQGEVRVTGLLHLGSDGTGTRFKASFRKSNVKDVTWIYVA